MSAGERLWWQVEVGPPMLCGCATGPPSSPELRITSRFPPRRLRRLALRERLAAFGNRIER
jgi:hypothetical protein